MKSSLINQNRKTCFCHCQIPKPLYCPIDCCCSCLCFLYESSPNLETKFFNVNESQQLIIPKKEKELFLKCDKMIKDKSPKTPTNNNRKNLTPRHFNKLDVNFPSKLNNININLATEDNFSNKKKSKKNNTFVQDQESNSYHKYKKIKVNIKKEDRALTCPVSQIDKSKKGKKKIELKNFVPISHNMKLKGKCFNNYELNGYRLRINDKQGIQVNKKSSENKKITNYYREYNLINNLNDNKKKFDSLMAKKLQMDDLNDDIIDNKENYSTLENKENKMIFQNLKNEIDKSKQIIKSLRLENEILKNKLYTKEQNIIKGNKINKSTNTTNYNNEKENECIILKNNFENKISDLKKEISEITFKINEYENFNAILKKRNNGQEKIINNKDKEISELKIKINNLQKENKDKIIKEKENISNDYKINNNSLEQEIIKLNDILIIKDKKIKNLEIKLKYEKKYDNKKQKILELLFNFYIKIKNIINYDKSKDSLKDIIEIMDVDDFEYKLNKVENKIIQIIDDIQIKYGHCFACDIACCTSHVDKLKSFRNNYQKKK